MPEMSELAVIANAELAALAVARAYAGSAKAGNTLRTYKAAWEHFVAWCASVGISPLPAEPRHVAAYVASLAGVYAPNSMVVRLSAIGWYHRVSGHPYDGRAAVVRETLRGVLRAHGRPEKQARAIDTEAVRRLVATCDGSPVGVRDRAMLLLAFAGALRRSELVGLHVGDVAMVSGGMEVVIRRSKGDQAGAGATVGIVAGESAQTCPVAAVSAWLALLGCESGPLFRWLSSAGRLVGDSALGSDRVRAMLIRRAALAGLEGEWSPHGLRAGFVTVAYRAGAREADIMAHTRHKSAETMRGYVRRAGLITESPARLLGL